MASMEILIGCFDTYDTILGEMEKQSALNGVVHRENDL